MISFVAIDFETANHSRDSACAVGLTAVRRGRIEVTQSFLIRPPDSQFVFTWIHGLRWEDVRASPTFGELWPTLQSWIDNAEFIAAHNAPFDSSILGACCVTYGIPVPRVPFTCTVQLARSQWESTRRGYPMSAVGFASPCVTTMRSPTRKRVHASY